MKNNKNLIALAIGLILTLGVLIWIALDDSHHYR